MGRFNRARKNVIVYIISAGKIPEIEFDSRQYLSSSNTINSKLATFNFNLKSLELNITSL